MKEKQLQLFCGVQTRQRMILGSLLLLGGLVSAVAYDSYDLAMSLLLGSIAMLADGSQLAGTEDDMPRLRYVMAITLLAFSGFFAGQFLHHVVSQ